MGGGCVFLTGELPTVGAGQHVGLGAMVLYDPGGKGPFTGGDGGLRVAAGLVTARAEIAGAAVVDGFVVEGDLLVGHGLGRRIDLLGAQPEVAGRMGIMAGETAGLGRIGDERHRRCLPVCSLGREGKGVELRRIESHLDIL